jgi:hypothetical protein
MLVKKIMLLIIVVSVLFMFIPPSVQTILIIPDGVTEIAAFAYSEYESLTSIVIPDSVTFIADTAFSSCTSLSEESRRLRGGLNVGRICCRDELCSSAKIAQIYADDCLRFYIAQIYADEHSSSLLFSSCFTNYNMRSFFLQICKNNNN